MSAPGDRAEVYKQGPSICFLLYIDGTTQMFATTLSLKGPGDFSRINKGHLFISFTGYDQTYNSEYEFSYDLLVYMSCDQHRQQLSQVLL